MKKIISAFVILTMLLFSAGCGSNNSNTDSPKKKTNGKADNLNISYHEVKDIKLEKYTNEDFSIDIPAGWKVESTPRSAGMFHTIRVYDEKKPINQMLITIKLQPFLHNESTKELYTIEGNAIMADAPILSNPTTEGFFAVYNEYAAFLKKDVDEYKGMNLPSFENFKATETLSTNKTVLTGSISADELRGEFTYNGTNGEGIFTAQLVDFKAPVSMGYDPGYYMAYNIMAITAEKDDFVNWEELLINSLKTLEYKDDFVSFAMQQSNETVVTSKYISKVNDQILDGIMDSWSKRNTSQDIISQKQSDATLGYERVYNVDTGEIYKAYNGFTDDYKGEKYQPITEDMYGSAIDGYISK